MHKTLCYLFVKFSFLFSTLKMFNVASFYTSEWSPRLAALLMIDDTKKRNERNNFHGWCLRARFKKLFICVKKPEYGFEIKSGGGEGGRKEDEVDFDFSSKLSGKDSFILWIYVLTFTYQADGIKIKDSEKKTYSAIVSATTHLVTRVYALYTLV